MEITKTKENEIQILLKLIAEKTEYTIEDLRGPSRKREIVHVRRAFFAIARKLLELPFEKIGNILNKDHATVMHSLTKHNAEIDVYDDYSKIYRNLYDSLSVLYTIRTEHNVEYMEKQMDILITKRDLLNDRIEDYKNKIKKLNAGKEG